MGEPTLLDLDWTAWRALEGSWNDRDLPGGPGLYRIRRVGQDALDYVGQTGRTLRARLRDLQPAFGVLAPYRDPHTAGPGIWALRQLGHTVEVSVAAVPGDGAMRLGREAVVISQHRTEFGQSPTLNFGRMPAGYAMSTARRGGVRSGPCEGLQSCHAPGHRLQRELERWEHGRWRGDGWSSWVPLGNRDVTLPTETGLYVIRSGGLRTALYIGQGVIRDRVAAHARKTSGRQAQLFRQPEVEVGWMALPGTPAHHLLELENDLISAYMLSTGTVPAAQFLGAQAAGAALEA